jgi:hypothetical protein
MWSSALPGQKINNINLCKQINHIYTCTRLAQSVERPTFNRVVVGSIPTSGAISFSFFDFTPS